MKIRQNKKAFTLVELLAVIIVISLLIVIAVPASISINKKIKQRLLNTKLDLATQHAKIWAYDFPECFTSSKSCLILEYVEETEKTMTVRITIGELARAGYFEYDDKQKVKILNPVDNSDLSQQKVTIVYNLKNKTVETSLFDPKNTIYTLSFNGNGATSGSMDSIKCNYNDSCQIPSNKYQKNDHIFAGWSKTVNGEVQYSDNDNITILFNMTLYAQWIELDRVGPTITMTPNKTLLPGTNVYPTSVGIKISATDVSGVNNIKYCTSTNSSCVPNITIANGASITLMGKTGSEINNTVCVTATDKAEPENTSEPTCLIYYVDNEKPKFSSINSDTWSNTTSTISCTATDNIGVRKLEWSRDNVNWTNISNIAATGPFLPSYSINYVTSNYINYFRSTDASGLVTNSEVFAKIDTAPPIPIVIDIKYSITNGNNIKNIECSNNEYLADGTINPNYNKYANNLCTIYTNSNDPWEIYWWWSDDYVSSTGASFVSHVTYNGACSSNYYKGGYLECMDAHSNNTINMYTVDYAGNKAIYYLKLTIN